ncbi:MAG: phosphopyruvate hydratase, partial [Alphaproteobacteria bacterium]|nr:phosphopyruvate hydratase [Alphaproteobacteria bacterium]
MKIKSIHAREILDSRGMPTVEVDVWLEDGSMGRAAVPSGASTGAHEALELRDGDAKRYLGKGVQKAVMNVNGDIAKALKSFSVASQHALDEKLLQMDGTPNKSRLGANAMLGVSLACARAAAVSAGQPLYAHLSAGKGHVLPVPMMNIINGGAHADNPLDVQEFMIMPVGAKTMADAVRMGSEVFHTLKKLLKESGHNTNVGDEGGFAPQLPSADAACAFIVKAIEKAGYVAGQDILLALDVAATELYSNGQYAMPGEGKNFTAEQLVGFYADLCHRYPIASIEDGMSEDDFDGWAKLTKALGANVQLV